VKYLVGDPANGPFADIKADLPAEEPARYFAAKAQAERFGEIADEMDWTDSDGSVGVLFIVT
jgi:hypothetical protein